ncbi:ubiquitin-conjugating enzyme E2 32-like [Prunus avium]|uniref:Ubiquitin-conjugating enzyme E2 32-like n=1 Tax=Prunus avium TaxID=42229 RepID=A0A6P5SHH3_PRUAV|nr:ubiquitin-conjugating enzyme E2 32-like [Prunus avium]
MELDRNQASKRILGLSAIERILLEYYEIESNPSDDFKCGVLERNISEWQFAVRGASGTEFEGGIYHGLVLFQREYPFKPPSVIPLTENGRFKTCTKIWIRRLNEWQPSWRVRDVFVDFIHLMPTYPDGELGSLEYNKEERRALAIKSRAATPKYGKFARQQVIEQIHEYMLSKSPPVPVPELQMTRYTPCQKEVVVDQVRSMQMESDWNVIAEGRCPIKNVGEKRILDEYNEIEIESNPSYDFTCRKLGWNKYEWQFAIRDPSGTEFEGWIYHGAVQFSVGYPSKSPSIMFLTENSCFKIQRISMS